MMRFVVGFSIFFFLACENDISDVNAVFDTASNSVEKVYDIEMIYSDSAQTRVRIIAVEMHRIMETRAPRQHFPRGVYVEFYDKEGNISSWLTADKADRYDREQQVVARENVILYNTDLDTFRSEELVWNSKEETIYTEGVFRFTNPDQDIVGYNFRSDQQFTDYSFHSMSGTTKLKLLEEEEKSNKKSE
jgi:LPS export ABC transporter protein LptC